MDYRYPQRRLVQVIGYNVACKALSQVLHHSQTIVDDRVPSINCLCLFTVLCEVEETAAVAVP